MSEYLHLFPLLNIKCKNLNIKYCHNKTIFIEIFNQLFKFFNPKPNFLL